MGNGWVYRQDYQIQAPAGYRVRILKVYGDLLLWPIGQVKPGTFAGVLFGLQNTAPDGSIRMDLGADNTMLYIQDATAWGGASLCL